MAIHSTQNSDFEQKRSLESIASEEIQEGNLKYQLYINFMDKKAFMYSYFYFGDDGKVWQCQITPNNEPLNTPISN